MSPVKLKNPAIAGFQIETFVCKGLIQVITSVLLLAVTTCFDVTIHKV